MVLILLLRNFHKTKLLMEKDWEEKIAAFNEYANQQVNHYINFINGPDDDWNDIRHKLESLKNLGDNLISDLEMRSRQDYEYSDQTIKRDFHRIKKEHIRIAREALQNLATRIFP